MAFQKRYVIDASIVIKWFSREEGEKEALDILRAIKNRNTEVLVPNLLWYEVGNALGKGKNFSSHQINEALLTLWKIGLQAMELTPERVARITYYMEAYKRTFYDAAYGALAAEFNAPLCSADTKAHLEMRDVKTISLSQFP